jgi:hypothetical protein
LESLLDAEECGAGLRPVPYEDIASNPSDYYDSATFEPSLSNPNDITDDISVLFQWAQCFKKIEFSFYPFTTIQENIDSRLHPPSRPLTPNNKDRVSDGAQPRTPADSDSVAGLGGGIVDKDEGDSGVRVVDKEGHGDAGDGEIEDGDGNGGRGGEKDIDNGEDGGRGGEDDNCEGGSRRVDKDWDGDAGGGEIEDSDGDGGQGGKKDIDNGEDGGLGEEDDNREGGRGRINKDGDSDGRGCQNGNGHGGIEDGDIDADDGLRGGTKSISGDEDGGREEDGHSTEDDGREVTPPESKGQTTHRKQKGRVPPTTTDTVTRRSVTRAAVSNAGRQLRKHSGELLDHPKPSKCRRRG